MKKNKLKKEAYTNFALISQISIHMLVPIFACVAIGVFIDKKYNTYLTLPLMIVGILAGGRNAYTLAVSVNRKSEGQKQSEEEQRMVDEAVEKWKEGKSGQTSGGNKSRGNEAGDRETGNRK